MARKPRGEMAIALSVTDIPETLWDLRRQLAGILRQTGDAEVSQLVKRRLYEIAAAFESGQGKGV